METDKHYFIEGLFIIGFALAAALFARLARELRRPRRRHLPDPFRGIRERALARRPRQVPWRRRRQGQGHGARSGESEASCRSTSGCARTRRSRPTPRRS